eukprot:CAMPEP_0196581570 /NCGR_PEP_ID=MMETSP1081-20130531/34329_1 /TAXON_ID=36882 /ORGANISM="Pyramimonas amylifera, Strain CCMP720" /LENGTH=239 /DNA_ID=CAMNT_0041901849 /DNA_START=98 /DNA_END=814 /DNA_ORIENTATION=+
MISSRYLNAGILLLTSFYVSLADEAADAACANALASARCSEDPMELCQGDCLSVLTTDANCASMHTMMNCDAVMTVLQCMNVCYNPTEEAPLPNQTMVCSSECNSMWGTCAVNAWNISAEAASPVLADCCNKTAEEWVMCVVPLFSTPGDAPAEAPEGDMPPSPEGATTCSQECYGYEMSLMALVVPCASYFSDNTLSQSCMDAAFPPGDLACTEACENAFEGCTDDWVQFTELVGNAW